MRKLIISVFCLMSVCFFSFSQSTVQLYEMGVDAYKNKDYDKSIICFDSLLSLGVENDLVYYNLGNSYYRNSQLPQAIWCYEKSLILNSSNEDAAFNLNFVNKQAFGEYDAVPLSAFSNFRNALFSLMPLQAWSIMFIVFVFAFVAALLLFFFVGKVKWRKSFFLLSIVMALFVGISLWQTIYGYSNLERSTFAIVEEASVSLKSSPDPAGTDIAIADGGAKVEIEDHSGEWIKISLPDGVKGWMLSSDVMPLSDSKP